MGRNLSVSLKGGNAILMRQKRQRAGGKGEGAQYNLLVNACRRVPPPASGEALCCSQLSRVKRLPSSRR